MLHGRLSAMLGARSILDSVTPSCEGRPPAGPRGPLPHLRARLARPAFPAPSVQEGRTFRQNSRVLCGEIVEVCPASLRGAERQNNPVLLCMDFFSSLA